MKKSRFSDQQMVAILRESDRGPVAVNARPEEIVAERDPGIETMKETKRSEW